MRRALAAAAALTLLGGALTACASAPPTRVSWWSGMSGTLLRACAAQVDGTSSVSLTTSRLGWRFSTATVAVRGGWSPPPEDGLIQFQPGRSAEGDLRAVQQFRRCMDRYPLDWSLALDDTASTRARLYPWYRDVLLPCMRRIGFASLRMPSVRRFLAAPYDRFDPYTSVLVNGPDQALVIQSRCPPAPPDVIDQARLAAASAGG